MGRIANNVFLAGTQTPANYIEDVFQTWLYTGNGSTQTITNGVDLAGKGGLVWIKDRSQGTGYHHLLQDTARGAGNVLFSNLTSAQTTDAAGTNFAFNSTGFFVGSSNVKINAATDNYVSWTFRKQPKFFDVVTFTGDNTNPRQIPHNLGAAPGMIIVKNITSTNEWVVWHRSLPDFGANGRNLVLNTTAAQDTGNYFKTSAEQTATYFTVGSVNSQMNTSGQIYVAYLFAHDAGGFGLSGTDNVISCGSFTTDGSGNATVNLGYEPQFVLFKGASGANANGDPWGIGDVMRGLTQTNIARLIPNLTNAEDNITSYVPTPTATGFDAKGFAGSTTYIYIAIRRGPMRTPTTGTSVYNAVLVSGNEVPNRRITGYGFPLDLLISAGRNSSDSLFINKAWNTRLGGDAYLRSPSTAVQDFNAGSLAAPWSAYMDGYQTGTNGTQQWFWNRSLNTYVQYGIRRAPGFFDVVCYTGNGVSGRAIPHNLGVTPELIIIKTRTQPTGSSNWAVRGPGGSLYFLNLNNGSSGGALGYFSSTPPSSSNFYVGSDADTNFNSTYTYIAYLFASCPGVSKVGSYTGTGTTLQINCGFTGSARFILIKRTDSTGDWYVWDSTRGVVAGLDPYLFLNTETAEDTTTDYVDTFSSGFEISSTAPAAINANGGSYIFLAIA